MFHILWSLSNFSQVLFFRGTRLYWNLTPTTKNFGFPTAYCVKKKTTRKKACGRLSKSQQTQTKERVRENPRGFKEGSALLHFFSSAAPLFTLVATHSLPDPYIIHSQPRFPSAWTMQHSIDFPRDRLPVSLFKTKPRYEYGLFNDFYTPKTSLRTSLWLITNFINSIGVHWSNKNFP